MTKVVTKEEFFKIFKEEQNKQLKLVLCKRKNMFGENEGVIAFLNQNEFYFVVGNFVDEDIIPGTSGRIIEGYYSGVSFSKLEDALEFFNGRFIRSQIIVLKSSINKKGEIFHLVVFFESHKLRFAICNIDKDWFVKDTNYEYATDFKNGIYFDDLTIALERFNSNLK